MNGLTCCNLIFYAEVLYILVYVSRRLLLLGTDSLILSDVMKVVLLLHVFSYEVSPLVRIII